MSDNPAAEPSVTHNLPDPEFDAVAFDELLKTRRGLQPQPEGVVPWGGNTVDVEPPSSNVQHPPQGGVKHAT